MSIWIPVLVRAEHLEAVSRCIVELETGRGATDSTSLSESLPSSFDLREAPSASPDLIWPTWSKEDLARLAEGSTTTTARWARAMDVCAEAPGTFFPTTEIAERSGMTVAEWRDAPRKITRHLKAHYPNVPRSSENEPVWPLRPKTRPEHPGQVSWAMTPETALIWKEVRS